MAIQALPQTTIRTLGSTQVLTDPASVVKELIDNALDAHATSLAIEISNNTLDLIQLRDNGHGIPPEDRHLVARPHCTSKIGSEDDLKDIGRSSLGFRGEALASVAEVSGSLTISTRTEGEQVATALKINRQGEVTGQERASLPVGTTVKIVDFIKSHPVRRQVALKATEKTLKKIKQLLQSYAFARPHVRLSLRVLKAKTDKGNWMYAPKPGGNAEDAAFKVVGAACASQCTWSVLEEHGFTIHAFLPRVDADPAKVSNTGSFISVDARPVTASRGTAKQLMKAFKEALRQAGSPLQGSKELFILLEVQCPRASYDANVEPAKDDVLFEDPDIAVAAARHLFEAVYPAKQPLVATIHDIAAHVDDGTPERHPLNNDDDFITSLERRPAHEESSHLIATSQGGNIYEDRGGVAPARQINDVARGVNFRSNMYGCDEEDLDLLDIRPPTGHTEADFEELRQARRDVTVSNPWVMAKLNASVRRPVPGAENNEPVGSSAMSSERRTADDATMANALPTPRPSSPTIQPYEFHPSDHVPGTHFARDGRMIGSQSLPPPEAYSRPRSPHQLEHEEHQTPASHRQPPQYNYDLRPRSEPNGTPLSSIPQAAARPRCSPQKQLRQTPINTPFVSPLQEEPEREKVWFDHLERVDRHRSAAKRRSGVANSGGLVTQGELGDLVDDPRPLARPRNNRDMRDFVQSIDLTENRSAASMFEGRNYPASKRGRSLQNGLTPQLDQDENEAPAKGATFGRGFMPASDFAAIEAHLGLVEEPVTRPTKRRRISEGRVLREISSNAKARPEIADRNDDDEYQPGAEKQKPPQRHRTADSSKIGRRRSSCLPLERTPAGRGTHNMVTTISTTTGDVAEKAGNVDQRYTLLNWEEPSEDAYDIFATANDPRVFSKLADKLHELLINRVSDGEMVQDLGELVRIALVDHRTGEDMMAL